MAKNKKSRLSQLADMFGGLTGEATKAAKKDKRRNKAAKCAEQGMDYDQSTGKCK